MAALVLVGSLVLGTGGAVGASELRGPGTALGGTWLGSYATFGGDPWVWCLDAGRAAPAPGHPWSATTVPAPWLAYLLATHGGLAERENHAALSYLVHTTGDLPHDAVVGVPASVPSVEGMDLPGRVQALRDDADRNAGPYTVPTSLEVAADGRSAYVVASVLSASGAPVGGRPLVARIEGPGAWADDGAGAWADDGAGAGDGTVLQATSGTEPTRWRLVATGDGALTVTVEAAVPPVVVTLFDPGRRDVQRVVGPAPAGRASGSASGMVRSRFVPHVTTRTSDASTTPGSLLSDLLEVGTAEGTSWPDGVVVEVVSTLWGPFEQSPAEADRAPAGAPVVGHVTTRVSGPGSVRTPGLQLPAPGYYAWTETIAEDEHHTGWASVFGRASETTFVQATPAQVRHEQPPVPAPAAPATPAAQVPPAAPVPADAAAPRALRELPRTGADPVLTASAGAVLLLFGGALAAGGARRAPGRHRAGRPGPSPEPARAPAPDRGAVPAGARRSGWVPERPAAAQDR